MNSDIRRKRSNWAVFSDFDGTIAHPDTLNFLAESFETPEFRKNIGRRIANGEISLREGIRQEVEAIRGSMQDVLDMLKSHVTIDAAFPAFARWCRTERIPLTVLSGGMRQVIETLLRPFELNHVMIVANRVMVENDRWRIEFLDETPWGHDKAAALRRAKAGGFSTIFLGDGLSDRGAAGEADIVFAKAGLAAYCAEQKIDHRRFNDFSEIQAEIKRLQSHGPTSRP
jgi:2-hydroxy-3-keto-5-methylthiopentenyl-1-phosphate phosphatase